MNPLISVVIPVYNHAKRIENSLRSLHRQSYRPLEVIIVDDGSTDNLPEVIHKVQSSEWGKSLQIKFIQQENKGAGAARNLGLKDATGQLVIFWDADTVGKPKMLEMMFDILQHHPKASYAYSQFRFGWKKIRCGAFVPEKLKKANYIDTTSLIRREAVYPFDENLKRFQDWDLWLTLLEKNRTGIFIPEVLFKKEVAGRKGYSSWIPSFMFRLPFKTGKVRAYETAREIVLVKHRLKSL